MDLLTSKIKPMYFRYLTAAFGSALISSIYGVVDMAMVGQYQGPEGSISGGCPCLEYYIQPGASYGNRRLCPFYYLTGGV